MKLMFDWTLAFVASAFVAHFVQYICLTKTLYVLNFGTINICLYFIGFLTVTIKHCDGYARINNDYLII